MEELRREIIDLFYAWGYELVIPPLAEYLDSLLTGMGTDLDLQTFKITDQLTGRLMGIRADMTPQVARMDAHRLQRDVPSRLCYLGPVLRTLPQGFPGSRNPLQVGAELYGHAGWQSDVEILRLMCETLRLTGIGGIYIDLGHVGIFRGLARQADLEEACEKQLFEALQRKCRGEVEELLSQWRVEPALAAMIAALAGLNGDAAVLEEAAGLLLPADASVRAALAGLRAVYAASAPQLQQVTWHFDLAELTGYHYHTGIVFAAYIPAQGQALARGGRYDDIGGAFGRARPATGFSADLKSLVSILDRGLAGSSGGIYAPYDSCPLLQQAINQHRAAGERVVCGLPESSTEPRSFGCDRKFEFRDGRWMVVAIE